MLGDLRLDVNDKNPNQPENQDANQASSQDPNLANSPFSLQDSSEINHQDADQSDKQYSNQLNNQTNPTAVNKQDFKQFNNLNATTVNPQNQNQNQAPNQKPTGMHKQNPNQFMNPHFAHMKQQNARMRINYACFWHKACAFFIDGFILTVCGGIANVILGVNSEILLAIFTIFYSALSIAIFESSPGGIAMGLKVCDESGEKIGIGRAFARALLSYLSAILLGIGYIMSAFTEKNQTLHDMIAKTYVRTDEEGSNVKYFIYSIFIVIGISFLTAMLEMMGFLPDEENITQSRLGSSENRLVTKNKINKPKRKTKQKKQVGPAATKNLQNGKILSKQPNSPPALSKNFKNIQTPLAQNLQQPAKPTIIKPKNQVNAPINNSDAEVKKVRSEIEAKPDSKLANPGEIDPSNIGQQQATTEKTGRIEETRTDLPPEVNGEKTESATSKPRKETQKNDNGLNLIDNPKWISSAKKIKKKFFSKSQIFKKLKLEKANKMPSRLANLQKTSSNQELIKKDFSRAIPLKFKGIFINPISKRMIEIGKFNNLFYHTLSFEVLDSSEKKLIDGEENFYNKLIIKSFWLPKEFSERIYKLKIIFPQSYLIVYFSKKDEIGSAYKLKSGTIIQLKQKTSNNFEFAVQGSKADLANLRFVPFNSSNRVMGHKHEITSVEESHTFNLNTNEPINFVAMVFLGNKDQFNETFMIKQ